MAFKVARCIESLRAPAHAYIPKPFNSHLDEGGSSNILNAPNEQGFRVCIVWNRLT
jgi:hypothetical protein